MHQHNKKTVFHQSEIVTTNSRWVVVWLTLACVRLDNNNVKKLLVLMFVVSHMFEKRWVTSPGSPQRLQIDTDALRQPPPLKIARVTSHLLNLCSHLKPKQQSGLLSLFCDGILALGFCQTARSCCSAPSKTWTRASCLAFVLVQFEQRRYGVLIVPRRAVLASPWITVCGFISLLYCRHAKCQNT